MMTPSHALATTALLALGASLASGCPNAFSTRCADDRECPTDFFCRQGSCRSIRADASTDAASVDRLPDDAASADRSPADAAASDQTQRDALVPDTSRTDVGLPDQRVADGGATSCSRITPGSCGSVSVFRDDFADGIRDQFWNDAIPAGCAMVEQDGALKISGSSVPTSWVSRTSWFSADLTGDAISVQVDWSALGNTAGAYFEFLPPVGSTAGIAYYGGALHAYTWSGGPVEHGTITAPSPTQHAWWRIREQDGNIAFETAADGCTWNAFGQTARPGDWDSNLGMVWLAAGGDWTGNRTFAVDFRSLNMDRPPGEWCLAGTLQDGFAGSQPGPAWLQEKMASSCQITTAGGLLKIDATLTTDDWCGVVTRQAYRLDDVTAKIDLTSASGVSSVLAGLALWVPWRSYAFGRVGDELWVLRDRTQRKVAPYQGQSHLRAVNSGSTLQFQASTDGSTWTPFWSDTPPASFDAVELGVGVQDVGTTTSTTVHFEFDNFNLR